MPAKSYKSASDFRKALEHRLQALSEQTGQNLQHLRRKVAFNRFLARIFAEPSSPWLLKGGYAMELRLHNARATRDIDLAFKGKPMTSQTDYIQRLLSETVNKDLGDYFTFRIGAVQMELDGPLYGGARYPVEVLIDNRLFVSFHADAAVGDYIPQEIETTQEQDILSFAGIAPAKFRMIPREVQFAEKLHAYTLPRAVPNSRVRDLVDMALLIREGKLATVGTKAALKSVFTRRKTHDMPIVLEPAPASWEKTFADMARACGLPLNLHTGFELLNSFYLQITQSIK